MPDGPGSATKDLAQYLPQICRGAIVDDLAMAMVFKGDWENPFFYIDNDLSGPALRRVLCLQGRPNRPSSLHPLLRLAPELQFEILEMLDVRSVARLSWVSVGFYNAVRSHKDFTTMTDLPETRSALLALYRMGMQSLHTLGAFRKVLYSASCTTCPRLGLFLFLPTLQRCCAHCLGHNPQFWLVAYDDIRHIFQGMEYNVPYLPHDYARQRTPNSPRPGSGQSTGFESFHPYNLYPRQLVAEVAPRLPPDMASKARRQVQPATDLRDDLIVNAMHSFSAWGRSAPRQARRPASPQAFPLYFGAILFPHLDSQGALDAGVFCNGCRQPEPRESYYYYDCSRRARATMMGIIKSAEELLLPPCKGIEAYSRESFLEHAKHCEGVQRLVSEAEQKGKGKGKAAGIHG
ncbi:hypothetical protein B0T16DRAFT_247874 [Cercophora newfieldiana]|uniref:F-box domain-containing protein n=1 Tax=Cercophora newfieldiana TaxID=92897 RepID=A0AA39XU73_9PEZI|nr:hypothetical protein B0T16DRAFT_247874 [Cercophora newfieldiana]